MTRKQGFTLIELLVVIGVIGILAAITSIGSQGLLARARLNDAIITIESQLSEARRLAKRLDKEVVFEVYQDMGEWRVAVDGTSRALPGSAIVNSGPVELSLDAPYGTFAGGNVDIELAVREATASITVAGILARTVVIR